MHYRPWGPCSAPAAQDLGDRLEYLFAEAAIVEFFLGCGPIDSDRAVDTKEHNQHCFSGGYRVRHSCRNFTGRYVPYVLMTVLLEKLRLVAYQDNTEADSLLAFKHVE
jgi:hypothetical protein